MYHVSVNSLDMTLQYDIVTFFTLEMIKRPVEGSVQSLLRKCAKNINLT